MKKIYFCTLAVLFMTACHNSKPSVTLNGTYELMESTTIKGTDTILIEVDSSKSKMIKMFNDTYFSFFNHDLSKGVDSSAMFVSGAGNYVLQGNKYIENLEFCSYRPWEGKQFVFTMQIKGDTLIQEGVEEIPELGIKQHITEKYIRVN